jgi:hypothetical protein
MKPLTVNELSALLDKAIKFGYGDRIVCVSDDEECNGYHCLYRRNFGSGDEIQYLDQKDGNIKYENSIIID